MPSPLRRAQAEAPGSLMMLGEHAVLRGYHCCVCAIHQRLRVTLSPRPDPRILLHSSLGHFETSLPSLPLLHDAPPHFRFVLAAIRHRLPSLPTGFSLHIQSNMSPLMGLGTSAAVTVATLAALHAAAQAPATPRHIAPQARTIIRSVQQNRGSGADAYASAYGGLLLYRQPPKASPQPPPPPPRTPATHCPPLTLLYAGYKTPTPQVIAFVEQRFASTPTRLAILDHHADLLAKHAFAAATHNHWLAFATCMEKNQRILEDYGVADAPLRALLRTLHATPGILGAKISGSGLGDCVLGLGAPSQPPPVPALSLALSPLGLTAQTLD